MKLLLFCVLCAATIACFGQSQKDLLKKYDIRKVTSITQEEDAPDKTTIMYYDDKGNDTATYTYGNRYQYAVLSYDKQRRITIKKLFWDDGKPFMTYTYTYSKDGSFRVDDEDTQFKMRSTSWYNTKGNAIKVNAPDGTIRTYVYDTKGNVIKYQTALPGKKVKVETAKHKSDNIGRVIETVWSNGSKSTYTYDDRGLLIESTTESKGDEELAGYKAKTTYIYQ